MEADLRRFYGVDYRDRWRGGLSLRLIHNLVSHLPLDSATATAIRGGPHWSLEAHLLDDVRMVLTHTKDRPAKPHPLRVAPARTSAPSPERRRRLAEARARARERRRAIEAGEIT